METQGKVLVEPSNMYRVVTTIDTYCIFEYYSSHLTITFLLLCTQEVPRDDEAIRMCLSNIHAEKVGS